MFISSYSVISKHPFKAFLDTGKLMCLIIVLCMPTGQITAVLKYVISLE